MAQVEGRHAGGPGLFLAPSSRDSGWALPGIMLGFSLLVLLVIPKGIEKQA